MDAHNINTDTFCQYPVTTKTRGVKGKRNNNKWEHNNSDALAETLKLLTINDAAYYNSDKMTQKAILQAIQKVSNHTSDREKRLSTLATKICNKYYWSTGPSQSSPRQVTLILKTGLWLMERLKSSLWFNAQKNYHRRNVQQCAGSPESWACKQEGQGQ